MKILIPILLLFFIIGCAAQSVNCPDGSTVATEADCPLPPMPDPIEDVPDVPDEPVAPEEPQVMDADVLALFERSSKVNSVSFIYTGTEKVGTDEAQITKRTYTVLGDKVRVDIPVPPQYSPDTFADLVYLDLTTKTATGFCTEGKNCMTPQPREASYNDYKITTPIAWLGQVPTNAYIKGNKQFDGKTQMTIIRYEKDGLYFEMLVQPHYGMPVSVGAYKTSNLGDMVWRYEYRDVAYNLVKEADVTPPE
ncbi:hypothetical protein GOV07_00630 [Candidatus Woesearchaeota archaeon]|nr:hypothetical protein [Candidatus Woesearchaeota archaeon]